TMIAGFTGTADVTVALNGGALEVTSGNNTDSIAISSTGSLTGSFGATTSAKPTNSDLGALSGTLTVQVGSAAVQTIQFGTGAGQVSNRVELAAALGNLTGVTATINGTNQIEIAS